jgi:hypothetical protein
LNSILSGIKTLIKSKPVLISIELVSILVLVYIVYALMQFDRSVGQTQQTMFTMGLLLIVYVAKVNLDLHING